MSSSTSPPGQPGQERRPENQEDRSWFQKFAQIAQQALIIWVVTQLATKFLTSRLPTPSEDSTPGKEDSINALHLPPVDAFPTWELGRSLSMHVYLSSSLTGDVFSERVKLPSIVWENITFGNWSETREVYWDVRIPESTRNNGSLWADVFLVKDGASPNPYEPTFKPASVHHVRKLLTPYMLKTKIRKEKNLLSASTGDVAEEEPDVIVPHWNGNLTLALVSDAVIVPYAKLPPVILEHIHLVPHVRDLTDRRGSYLPIIFPNDFWHLRSQYQPVNESTLILPLHVQFQPISYFKFQLFASMTHGFNEAAAKQGGASTAELDEIKRMLVETNPWFLALTFTVSILHVIFEMLAFSSDVSHWRQKRELVGVSVRTIVTNVFVQLVVLLYLVDNNAETSWMVLFGSGVGVLIEAWKITKAVDISVAPAAPGSLLPYRIDIKDKHVLSEDEKKTQEYDKLAFRYVSYVTIPCLAGYTIYSLLYEAHRGWYSFVISTLTSFVYMFGFAQLIPQLIINYKLKSVAHMPMKAMIYKTLSTVVDDLFAFCIKMPLLHRLACFRDDVVFLVFLYQRWIYRIDPKRVNEYGQVMIEDAVKTPEGEESKKDR